MVEAAEAQHLGGAPGDRYAMDADITLYWPRVRSCWERVRMSEYRTTRRLYDRWMALMKGRHGRPSDVKTQYERTIQAIRKDAGFIKTELS